MAASPPVDPHFDDLAAYALGAMTPEEAAEFERTLAECETCRTELPKLRESVSLLDDVPPEMFLDGPPEDAELLVRRTVRGIRSAQPPTRTGARTWLVAAAAAVVLLVAGIAVGRISAPSAAPTAAPPSATSPQDVVVPGTRQATAVDAGTGARLTVKVVPAAGWVRVTAAASGIRAGQRCHLVVVSRSGQTVEAGSWLVSPAGASAGTTIDGAALVAPADVAAVRVQNSAGQILVTTEV